MKRAIRILVLAGTALSGCSEAEDSGRAAQDNYEEPAAFSDAAETSANLDDDGAWFFSDARPVNRACNEPGYRPGQPDTYPALHSPLYPVIEAKQQELAAAVKALAPKVTDEDMYDLEADLLLRGKINVLNQFVFVMGQDLAPRYLLNICNIDGYENDQCRMMQVLSGGRVALTNFERDGDSLGYVADLPADGSRTTLTIANRDLDGLLLQMSSTTTGAYRGEWERAVDGTETFNATGTDGTFSYTEKPDCSGEARAIRTDDGGHPWELYWRWSSVREPQTFWMQYSECTVNGLNERECSSGSI